MGKFHKPKTTSAIVLQDMMKGNAVALNDVASKTNVNRDSVNEEVTKADVERNEESTRVKEGHSSQYLLLCLEIGFIVTMVVVIWTLSAVAIILLGTSDSMKQQTEMTVFANTSCSPRVTYQGEACKNELKEWQECFSGPQTVGTNESIYIASNIDQEEMEEMANLFLRTGLPILRPSQECEAAIRPFLCLYLFGSCDTSNQFHHTSMRDCVQIRDEVCRQEWQQAVGFLGEGVLPTCEQLSSEQAECVATILAPSVTQNNTASLNDESTSLEHVNITCSRGFYPNADDTLCLPDCGVWVESGDHVERSVVVILFALQALISSIAFLIISLTLQRTIVFVFPTVYLVYVCIDIAVAALVMLIGFADKEALFCGSRNLIKALGSPTSFCTFSGIVYYYALIQTFIWMTFLALSLCWSVLFPTHYSKIKARKRVYLHIGTIVLGVVLPLVTTLVHLKDGYTIASRPAVTCNPQNVDYIFYAFALPICILLAIAASSFFLVVYTLLKVFIQEKLKRLQLNTVKQKSAHVSATGGIVSQVQTVQLVLVLCYFIFLVVFFQAILVIADQAEFTVLEDYFLCESVGNQGVQTSTVAPSLSASSTCASTTVDSSESGLVLFDDMNVTGMVLYLLLPLVILIFVNGISAKC